MSRQLRALRNGVVAAALTAGTLFVASAVMSEEEPEVRTSPIPTTPSPTPVCAPEWQVVPSEDPDPVGNQLLAVGVVTEDRAWAVGGSGESAEPAATLIQRWDGTAWTVVPSPNGGQRVNVLAAVDAVSSLAAWAVGFASDGFGEEPLIVRWDGTAWTLSDAPDLPDDAVLRGVAAVATDDAWSVGTVGEAEDGSDRALVLHWDGTAWTPVDVLPVVGGGRSGLVAVSASSATDVWAVGYHHKRPLVLRFDGTAWSRVAFGERATLSAVAALGPADAWVAGSAVYRFDGTAWAEMARPPVGSLHGLAAAGPEDAWAVGVRSQDAGLVALVERWDGTAWVTLEGPRVPGSEALTGASSLPDGTAWFVGYRDTAKGRRTLVARGTVVCTVP